VLCRVIQTGDIRRCPSGYQPAASSCSQVEQPVGRGLGRRGTLVSQSPSVIRQWLDELRVPGGGPPRWHAQPFATRAQAFLATQEWIHSH